jgi:hypothetical protein
MVLAFLQAEVYSPRFRSGAIQALGGDRSLVYSARLDDPSQNRRRKAALAAWRGFGAGTFLFQGFPSDVEWRRVALLRDEVGSLQYANYPTWVTLSAGSRLVRDGAANVERIDTADGTNANILAVERELRGGRTFAEMILAAENPEAPHIVVEGHARATAYARAIADGAEVEAIAGYSAKIGEWRWF